MRRLLEYVIVVLIAISLFILTTFLIRLMFDVNVYDIFHREVSSMMGYSGYTEVWSLSMRQYQTAGHTKGGRKTIEHLDIESGDFSAVVVIRNGSVDDLLNMLDILTRQDKRLAVLNPLAQRK